MEQMMVDANETQQRDVAGNQVNVVGNHVNVAAVVVTFNRLEKLKKVLASLRAQTRIPNQLIIVNNASTDGTDKYLEAYAHDFANSYADGSVKLTVVTLPENVGGAGGFSAGMRKGYELGADFVWIFDDDGYPQPQALEKLLEGFHTAVSELGPDVPYACSMVKFIDGSICEMNNPVPTWDWGRLIAKGFSNLVMVTSCSFVSVLIPRWVMEKHGLPFKEYFIWFDDAEYTLRITRVCPGVQVLDSVIVHDMGANKGVNFTMIDEKNAWKFAYGVRNQASYRLHHEGKAKYLLFCANVIRQMRRGHVARKLRRSMISQMLKAIRFNPKVDFPQK
ncbi:glycosyltransferase family 2 protein [Gardnerella vaginalis]|uniref:glycosyltransferase family 2 protein n=1 Tax=Gardnerella vaginalis TaxID=2702 RepID=UPI000354190E|nr:glycosyltransferase family 2 protein [Gardnerella vaginalis]EPI40709.1 glycosyltransferase, group 2 family protein [Gardnerella vaginalis JCP8481A]EPI44511.1 glycosyltransferase, group 2 family protein [Gardnerella vaginalis JCP8481B]